MRISTRGFVLAILVLLTAAPQMSAQFSVKRREQAKIDLNPVMRDMPSGTVSNEYFDMAAWNAEQRRIRHERNTVEFKSSLQTSMFQYEQWQGSDQNNFNVEASVQFKHQYKRDKFTLNYSLDTQIGMNKMDSTIFKHKDVTKFDLTAAWTIRDNWSYSAKIYLETQLTNSQTSRTDKTINRSFMAPGTIRPSIGFEYKKTDSPLSINVSPVTGSITTMLNRELVERHEGKYAESTNPPALFGVPYGKYTQLSVGPQLYIKYEQKFGKRKSINIKSTLNAYTPYAEPLERPDIDWDNMVEIKVTRYHSSTLRGRILYRKAVKDVVQSQYSFVIGLTYNFRNK